MDVILNTNFEIDDKKVITSTIALNVNHSKNQRFHVEFCYLINVFSTLWIKTKLEWKQYQKRVEIGTTLKINSIEKQRKYMNPKIYLGYILGDFQISMWYLKINPYA